MDAEYLIRTTWGPSGPQKALIRKPDPIRGVGDEARQRQGRWQATAAYGTPVPLVLGAARVPAVLVEANPKSWVYLVAEGPLDGVGRVAFGNDTPIPVEIDPANFAPGTMTQWNDWPGDTRGRYLGRAVVWRTRDGDIPPDISFEANATPVDSLQRTLLHDLPPSATTLPPWTYEAQTVEHNGTIHLVAMCPASEGDGPLPSIRYWRSVDGGRLWSGINGESGGTWLDVVPGGANPGALTTRHLRLCVDPSTGSLHAVWVATRPLGGPCTIRVADIRTTAAGGVALADLVVGTSGNGMEYGGVHLTASAHSGRLWLAWHDERDADHKRWARGIVVACRAGGVGAAWALPGGTTYADPDLNAMRGDQLGLGGTPWTLPLINIIEDDRLRCPVIAARPDGTAVVAVELYLRRSTPVHRLVLLPVWLNTAPTPDRVEWHPSVAEPGDPQGVAEAYAGASPHFVPVGWDGVDEAQMMPRDIPWGSVFVNSPARQSDQRRADIPGPQWCTVTRLLWLGEVAGRAGSDWIALVYPNRSRWGYLDGRNFWQPTETQWILRVTRVSDPGWMREAVVHSGNLAHAPALMRDGESLLVAVVASRTGEYWAGDTSAIRLRYDLGTLATALTSSETLTYVAVASGNDERAHNACPTPHGLVVHEWGDYDPGDAFNGRQSRLISYDATIVPELDWSPVDIFHALMTDPDHGAWPGWAGPWPEGQEPERLDDMVQTDLYCRAMGFLFSDVLTSQVDGWQHLCELFASANCTPLWSDGRLEWIPMEHQPVSGNGVSWTPKPSRMTPVYHLSRADFLSTLRPGRRPENAEINVLPIQYSDRVRNYAPVTMDLRDPAGIAQRGERRGAVVSCPWITSEKVASLSAWLRLRRERMAATTWEFELPARYLALQPMDLVTLTDPEVGLVGTVVRLRRIARDQSQRLRVTAEEIGTAVTVPTPPLPGGGTIPVVWYAPSILDASVVRVDGTFAGDGRPRVLVAVAGRSDWRGCEAWRRWNGGEWRKVGEILRSSPVGRLIEPMGPLRMRNILRLHPGLRIGLQDDWRAVFAGLTATNAIPVPGEFRFHDQPYALSAVGTEVIGFWERDAATHEATGGVQVWARTLQRGAFGTTIQPEHATGSVVGLFGPDRLEWIPDGRGMLEMRFPAKAIPGGMAEPLDSARPFLLEVP